MLSSVTMPLARRALIPLLGATALAACPVAARAQDGVPSQPDGDAVPQTAEPQAGTGGDIDPVTGADDIVVIARGATGSVLTTIKPVVELDETAIASYGASNVAELLQQISPQTRSGRGRGSGAPVVLVNGRRVSGFGEIRNLPPEAIRKVEVLPEEVALQYGFAADQRVVNFILKPDFRQLAVDVEQGFATRGGRPFSEYELNYLTIGDKRRFNVDITHERSALLTEAERGLGAGDLPGGGVDAAFRSLLLGTRRWAAEAVLATPLPLGLDGSANLRFERSDSDALLGIDPGAPVVAASTLRRDGSTETWSGGATASRALGGWRWTLTGAGSRATATTLTDRPGAPGAVDEAARDFATSRTTSLTGDLVGSGPLTEGWAGPIRATLATTGGGLWLDTVARDAVGTLMSDLERTRYGGRATLAVPLFDAIAANRRRVEETADDPASAAVPRGAGRLSLNASVNAAELSDFGRVSGWSLGGDWDTPIEGLSMIATRTLETAAPGLEQLGAPVQTNPGQVVFDFATGTSALITTITGGNPALIRERRRDWRVGLNYQPPALQPKGGDLALSVDWNRNRSFDVTSDFPTLTPAIEAAFPGRVVRDAAGALVSIDFRPVTYDRIASENVRWGVNLSRSFGQSQRGGPGAGVGRPPGAGRPAGAPPRGAGGGGGSSGGRFFGGPGGDGGRWQASLYHTIRLDERVVIRPGVPELDLLAGDLARGASGLSRHEVELDGGHFHKGIGFRGSLRWDGGSRLGSGSERLRFAPLATVNLRAFVRLDQQAGIIKAMPVLKGTTLRFVVDNLFDSRRRVTDAGGETPFRYQPGFIDPLGRTLLLDLRKSF